MNEISLYIHIPFCKSKCNYCDFFSKSIDCSFNFFQDEYVNALCNEISFYFYNSNLQLYLNIDNLPFGSKKAYSTSSIFLIEFCLKLNSKLSMLYLCLTIS